MTDRIVSAGLPPGFEPETEKTTPPVVFWFRVYLIAACVIGALLLALAGALLWAALTHRMGSGGAFEGWLVAGIYGAAGVMTIAIHVVPLVAGRRRWVHGYGLFVIISGMVLCCWAMPAAIPMLIYWTKPEVKSWYEGEES